MRCIIFILTRPLCQLSSWDKWSHTDILGYVKSFAAFVLFQIEMYCLRCLPMCFLLYFFSMFVITMPKALTTLLSIYRRCLSAHYLLYHSSCTFCASPQPFLSVCLPIYDFNTQSYIQFIYIHRMVAAVPISFTYNFRNIAVSIPTLIHFFFHAQALTWPLPLVSVMSLLGAQRSA